VIDRVAIAEPWALTGNKIVHLGGEGADDGAAANRRESHALDVQVPGPVDPLDEPVPGSISVVHDEAEGVAVAYPIELVVPPVAGIAGGYGIEVEPPAWVWLWIWVEVSFGAVGATSLPLQAVTRTARTIARPRSVHR
jgi:hypothetical protein